MKSFILRFLLCYFLICGQTIAFAQSTAAILPQGKTQFLDNNGNPLSSGKVYFYIPNTTTFKTTWQDSDKSVANTNPVILDAAGRAIIYGDGTYRQIVRTSTNTTIYDAVTASVGTGGNTTATGDGDLVATIKPWAGLSAPNQYAFAYGQEISRTTYSILYAVITLQQTITCTNGSAIASGFSDTSQIPVTAVVESICFAPGTTVLSKTSTTVTFSANSSISTSDTIRIFLYGNGNGSTTFNLPDLRGQVIAGRCNMGGTNCTNLTSTYFGTNPQATGAKGGLQTSTLATTNLPAYTPTGAISSITPAGSVATTTTVTDSRTWSLATSYFGTYNGTNQDMSVTTGTASTLRTGTVSPSGSITASSSSSFTGNSTTPTFTGVAQGGLSTAFANIQPTQTLNYIIKITPDSNSADASGVTSIQSMTGDIACGTGLSCTGNIISVNAITAGVSSFNGLTGIVANDSSNKVCYVSTAGNNSNNGFSWESSKLTLQACEDLLSTSGTVIVGGGTYTLSSTYNKRPSITTYCIAGATIKRANATSIDLVDFQANSANDGIIDGCILDANRVNNTDGSNQIIKIGSANNITIKNSSLINSTGTIVYVTTGLKSKILNNKIDNAYSSAITCASGVANTDTQLIFEGNTISSPGLHALVLQNCDGALITGNKFQGSLITGSVVSNSGTTISSISGTNFANVKAGMFMIYVNDAGTKSLEALVTSVTNNTTLIVNAVTGIITSKPVAFGTGDMISIDTSAYAQITNNQITGGIGGIVIYNGTGGLAAQDILGTNISGNNLANIGGGAIGLFAGTKVIKGTSITGNSGYNIGIIGSTIIADAGRAGIYIESADVTKTSASANSFIDNQGSSTLSYGISLNAVVAGQLALGKNPVINAVNSGIFGGIISQPLTGWGAGATISSVTFGNALSYTVTAGTGPSATPSVAFTLAAVPAETPSNFICNFVGGTGFAAGVFVPTAGFTGGGLQTFFQGTTPTNALTYIFKCVS